MSLKFKKNRSVDFAYHAVPCFYTGIRHPRDKNKELVIVDFLGPRQLLAAYRNNRTNKVGRTFILKHFKGGFVFKDKKYYLKSMNMVW